MATAHGRCTLFGFIQRWQEPTHPTPNYSEIQDSDQSRNRLGQESTPANAGAFIADTIKFITNRDAGSALTTCAMLPRIKRLSKVVGLTNTRSPRWLEQSLTVLELD